MVERSEPDTIAPIEAVMTIIQFPIREGRPREVPCPKCGGLLMRGNGEVVREVGVLTNDEIDGIGDAAFDQWVETHADPSLMVAACSECGTFYEMRFV